MSGMSPMSQYLYTVLLGAAVLHGLFLSIILLRRSNRQLPVYLLSTCIFFISTMAVAFLLYLSGFIFVFPHLLAVFFPGFYLIGVLFYLYIRTSIEANFIWKKQQILHFLPFALIFYLLIPVYSLDTATKLEMIQQFYYSTGPTNNNLSTLLFNNGPVFHIFLYTILAINLLRKKARQFSKKEEQKKIGWLKRFAFCFLLLLLSDLITQFLFWYFNWDSRQMNMILVFTFTIFLHVLGYFTLGVSAQLSLNQKNTPGSKYRTSPLTEQGIATYIQKIKDLLEQDKPFLNPKLKISDLAFMMQLPSHQLSQVLNEGLNTNFYDLINQYRVEEIKKRLGNPRYHHYSILAIALDCGFNNKTTFNRVFKKYTGKTPSRFLKEKSQTK